MQQKTNDSTVAMIAIAKLLLGFGPYMPGAGGGGGFHDWAMFSFS
jgi:hypothetical protein